MSIASDHIRSKVLESTSVNSLSNKMSTLEDELKSRERSLEEEIKKGRDTERTEGKIQALKKQIKEEKSLIKPHPS